MLQHDAALRAFVGRLSAFDYIVCPSRMAVRVLAQTGTGPLATEGRIVAIGKDQDAVREMLHTEPALTDAEPSMMGIVEALRRLPRLAELRIGVLLPSFEGLPTPSTITNFMDALTATEAHIETVACYRTSALSACEYPTVAETLMSPGLAAIALTSGGEAHVLARILRFAADRQVPVGVPVYSFGPYTTQCASEAQLNVAATSPAFHSFDDYVRFLIAQV